MNENEEIEFGIKYRVLKISPNKFMLFPIALKKGKLEDWDFKSDDKEVIPIVGEASDLKKKYVIDSIYSIEELRDLYDFDDGEETDDEFLGEYFYNDFSEKVFYAEIDEKTGIVAKYEIDLALLKKLETEAIFVYEKDIPSVLLNGDSINELLACEDIKEVKILLEKYKRLIDRFKEYTDKKGVTRVKMINGKIDEIDTLSEVESGFLPEGSYNKEPDKKTKTTQAQPSSEISYNGLRKAIKEKVFGHDEAIDTFAQKLYMNVTAEEGESVDSILLVGPTGTGKTETVEAAASYLGIPYVTYNASNLVPQGIRGITIEDILCELYVKACSDIEKAQRGLVFLDEFEKLSDSDLDIKTIIRNIMLTFTSGGTFPVENDHYSFMFDSKMTNKVYAGVFERIYETKKAMGFGSTKEQTIKLGTDSDVRKKIMEKGYFTLEQLSRISTLLTFDELTREIKKQILLKSKLSILAKKRERYKRQFGIDILADDSFIDAVLDSISNCETGMRSVNNILTNAINNAEKSILENETKKYKKLVLTKDTVSDPNKFDLS